MRKKYLDCSIKEYLDDLSAKLPAPGGGSAAALVSATGVSCLLMVVNFTIGKKGYEEHQTELKEMQGKLTTYNLQLTTFIDEDVTAYIKLSDAYKLPKEDTLRSEKIQIALKNALSVPCKIFEISVGVLTLAERLKEIGNKNLISDVACGVSILRAGIESAKSNIDANLKCMDDVEFVKETKIKYEKIIKKIEVKL
ncbi:MAG: cyclodeaminase/cyclohydrolase family protein [Elusimicrobiota bacterium]